MERSEGKFWTNFPPSVSVCSLQFTCSAQTFKPGRLWCWRGCDCEIPAATQGPEEFRVNKLITYLKSHLEKCLYLSLSTIN